jgi:hypothetical protein
VPYRIERRLLFVHPSGARNEEQKRVHVADPNYEPKPAIITTPSRDATDDHQLAAMDFGPNPNDARSQSDWFYYAIGGAAAAEEDFGREGWAAIGWYSDNVLVPALQEWDTYSEMRRITLGLYNYIAENWRTSSAVGRDLTAYAYAMEHESPRTMPTIQEWLAGVDRYGKATDDILIPDNPGPDTPLWMVDVTGPAIDLPPLGRIAHELRRVVEHGALSLTQEGQRWAFIASKFPGTPEGDRAQQVASWCASQPLGADRTPYAAWVAANFRRTLATMTDAV